MNNIKALLNKPKETPVAKRAVYKAVGLKAGRCFKGSILRCDKMGFYDPKTPEEITFLESLVAKGFIEKLEV